MHLFTAANLDGAGPYAGVVEGSDGALYGMTPAGGNYGRGTVFRLSKDGSGYVVLWSFGGAGDGTYPDAGLVEGPDGALYGVTGQGGVTGAGVVFRMRKDGSAYAVLRTSLARSCSGTG